MPAPYFKDVIVGNVGEKLLDLGYTVEAIQATAHRLADEWMRINAANSDKDPRQLVVHSELDISADGSSIEPLHLVFRLMPRSNGEMGGWLMEATPEEIAAKPSEKRVSPLKWSVRFSVVNAVWEDGTASQGYMVFSGEPGDLDQQAAFDDPRKALEFFNAHVLERLGLTGPED